MARRCWDRGADVHASALRLLRRPGRPRWRRARRLRRARPDRDVRLRRAPAPPGRPARRGQGLHRPAQRGRGQGRLPRAPQRWRPGVRRHERHPCRRLHGQAPPPHRRRKDQALHDREDHLHRPRVPVPADRWLRARRLQQSGGGDRATEERDRPVVARHDHGLQGPRQRRLQRAAHGGPARRGPQARRQGLDLPGPQKRVRRADRPGGTEPRLLLRPGGDRQRYARRALELGWPGPARRGR